MFVPELLAPVTAKGVEIVIVSSPYVTSALTVPNQFDTPFLTLK
jgi:hypothetical protein